MTKTSAAAWNDCVHDASKPDLYIRAGTNDINSGKERGEKTAIACFSRGTAYFRKRD